MATIKQVEQRIHDVEGFHVRILYGRDGRDVRSDKTKIKQYPFRRALKHSKNVKSWREGRFASTYQGYEVEVLHSDGSIAHGGTLLGTVRDDYLAEE